jgi:hypothetical protein
LDSCNGSLLSHGATPIDQDCLPLGPDAIAETAVRLPAMSLGYGICQR